MRTPHEIAGLQGLETRFLRRLGVARFVNELSRCGTVLERRFPIGLEHSKKTYSTLNRRSSFVYEVASSNERSCPLAAFSIEILHFLERFTVFPTCKYCRVTV